jgi:hypothetical protein
MRGVDSVASITLYCNLYTLHQPLHVIGNVILSSLQASSAPYYLRQVVHPAYCKPYIPLQIVHTLTSDALNFK